MLTLAQKRCWAQVDLAALERNIRKIRARLPMHLRYLSVVKADAYGHGITHVVPRLMQGLVDGFAVANVAEGAMIRELGSGWPILVLGPVLPEEAQYLADYDLIASVSSLEELSMLSALAKAQKPIAIQVKVDTGMGRSGVWHQEALELLDKLDKTEGLNLCGIYSHFGSADCDSQYTQIQRERFDEILKTRELLGHSAPPWVHIDNSAGIGHIPRTSHVNAVRIGLLQLGIFPGGPVERQFMGVFALEPVLSLYARVGLIKALPAGVPISYGGHYVLDKESKVALITAGYGDGVALGLSNKGAVLIAGKRCPILGRVTMDQMVVDVSHVPNVSVGDSVTLIGRDGTEVVTIADWCVWSGSIAWDLYCSITKRVPRLFHNNDFI